MSEELVFGEKLKQKLDQYGQDHVLLAERDGAVDQLCGNAVCRVDTLKGEYVVKSVFGNKVEHVGKGVISVKGLTIRDFNTLANLDEVYAIDWARDHNLTH